VAYSDEVLRRAPLFEALDEDGTKALRAGIVDVALARGDRLFDEGDAGDRLYVVLDGKIKLTRTAPDGRENLLSVLGPGEMFGELSLFDPRPRTASAVAVTDARLAGLGHDYLRHWLTGRPDVAMHLLRALAQRLRRTNDVMADAARGGIPGDREQGPGGLLRPGLAATARQIRADPGPGAAGPPGALARSPGICTGPPRSWHARVRAGDHSFVRAITVLPESPGSPARRRPIPAAGGSPCRSPR